jgi:recombinational DNA repair protein RecR
MRAVVRRESPADVVAVESSGSYRGYFMGHLSPLTAPVLQLGLAALEARLAEAVCTRIPATNPTVEGDATARDR